MDTPTKTILITGTDLAGKTTLVNGLVVGLKDRGYDIVANKFDLQKTQLMTSARHLMDENWEERKLVINGLLALSFLVDGITYQPPQNIIFIQDSYVERTIAYCYTYNIPHVERILDLFREKLFHFDINIYLTADIETRRKRLLAMGNNNFLDNLVIRESLKSECMDKKLESIAQNEKNYLKIDTTPLSISEVRDIALKYIEALL